MNKVPPFKTASTQTPMRIFSVPSPLKSGAIADEAFLDAVVENWRSYQVKGDPRFPDPPAYLIPAASVSIGHELDSSIAKDYAERSDLPAVGWPEDIYREGPFLYARLRRIPEMLARWIETGAYKKVSAEFYEQYKGFGPTLRRISILGAGVPACKDLGDIPTLIFDTDDEREFNPVVFCEEFDKAKRSRSRFAIGNTDGYSLVTFVEELEGNASPISEKDMNPQQQAILTALQSMGIDVTNIDASSLDKIIAAAGQAAAATNADPNAPVVRCAEKQTEGDDTEGKEKKPDVSQFAEMINAAVAAAVGPIKAELATEKEKNKQNSIFVANALNAKKRAEVTAFCESNKDRLFPYETDPKFGATIVDQLCMLSDDQVSTFGEGDSKVQLTPMRAMMKLIENRPSVSTYAEILPDPKQVQNMHSKETLLGMSKLGEAVLKKAAAAKA